MGITATKFADICPDRRGLLCKDMAICLMPLVSSAASSLNMVYLGQK
jgi:hypothetical protein